MDLLHTNIKKNINTVLTGNKIDISNVGFIDPWSTVIMCLLSIERSKCPDRELVLPVDLDILHYLKRIHMDEFLKSIGYESQISALLDLKMPEYFNLNVCELKHCEYRDEFTARLDYFLKMFENFGLNNDDANRMTSLVGELGNNVFDHNSGNWPLDTVGCIICGQNYPKQKRIEIVIGDPGIGFYGSLINAFPELKDDKEAIIKGLDGNTGRIGEKRGNGLKLIQEWTINNFSGYVTIHSREGAVRVDKDGIKSDDTYKIVGTVAQIVIYY